MANVLTVRVSDEVWGVIESRRGETPRSEYARGVLEAALTGTGAPDRNETRPDVKPVAAKVVEKPVAAKPAGRADRDAEALLEHVRGAPRVVRKLPEEMGWLPLRVDRVLRRLGGSVRFEGGMVVASEE